MEGSEGMGPGWEMRGQVGYGGGQVGSLRWHKKGANGGRG